MAYKIYTKGNYFYIVDTLTNRERDGLSKNVRVTRGTTNQTNFYISGVNDWDNDTSIPIASIQDESGSPYADADAFIDFYKKNTGQLSYEIGIDQIDTVTDSVNMVDYAHHEIHSGNHYFCISSYDILKAGVNDSLIITPNTTKWAHLLLSVDTHGGQMLVELSESATYSDIGDLVTVRNRNRNVADNNTTLVYEDPTITDQGTVIMSMKLGVDSKQISVGGGARGSNELILKQNTVYLVRLTEQNVDATFVNLEFDWYEHISK